MSETRFAIPTGINHGRSLVAAAIMSNALSGMRRKPAPVSRL